MLNKLDAEDVIEESHYLEGACATLEDLLQVLQNVQGVEIQNGVRNE